MRVDLSGFSFPPCAQPRVVVVQSRDPDGRGRFRVTLDGRWMESWSLDRIKEAVAVGAALEES